MSAPVTPRPAAKAPTDSSWRPCGFNAHSQAQVWERHGVRVLSSLGYMQAPDGSGDGLWTWLVSVSREGAAMATNRDVRARRTTTRTGSRACCSSWSSPSRRVECECKTGETVIVRADGFRYSVEKERS